MKPIRLLILSLLHCTTDCYSSFIVALWLVLGTTFENSGVPVGVMVAVTLIPANIMQPIWGVVSDRLNAKWLIVFGPLLAVVCLSMLGLVRTSVGVTILLMAIGQMGVGLFHPEAATLAARLGAAGSPRTMSLFLSAGFLGQAIGPWLISQVINDPHPRWLETLIGRPSAGYSDSWLTLFPGLLCVGIGLAMVARMHSVHSVSNQGRQWSFRVALHGRQRPVWTLIALNVVRIFGLLMLQMTIPKFLEQQGRDQLAVGNWLAVFLVAQTAGILFGGLSAPPQRERTMLIWSVALSVLPACVVPFCQGNAALLALAITGFCVAWTHPICVRLGQAIVPGGERWISGMLIGVSWGVGALIGPLLVDYICSRQTAALSMAVGSVTLIVALLLALKLPSQEDLNALQA